MKVLPRHVFLQLHLWAGLTLGLVLAGVAFSGAMLAWRPQLDPRLNAHLMKVVPGAARLAPDDLVARARAAHPAGELESVRYYGRTTAPFLVYFTTRDFVHLNPYTGEVLGFRQRYGDFFGWFEGFHKFLQLEPSVGEPLTGSLALIFGGIIFTGLVLGWPGSRRALRASLTLNPKLSGRPWHLNVHKTVGAYASLMLGVSVLSGAVIAFDWAKEVLYPLTVSRKEAPVRPAPEAGEGFAGFTPVSQRLAALMPAAEETYITVPKKGVVTAYVIAADAPHPNARSYVWFNPADAAVRRFSPYAEASRGYRLYYWILSLHTGMMGGWLGQLLLFLGAISVPLLAGTGVASFLQRKFRPTASSVPPGVPSTHL